MCTKYIHLLGVKPGKVGAVWKMGNSHSSSQTNSVNSKNTTVKIINDTHLNKLDLFDVLKY